MQVAIIKYNAGNIYSVDCAMKRLGVNAVVTSDIETIIKSDRVIFPGQGEAPSTMQYLKAHGLDRVIKELKQPVLGICIGMQLMCRRSDEGNVDCLGIFDTEVKQFMPKDISSKVPHMGWNTIRITDETMFPKQLEEAYLYFVHSYYVPLNPYTSAQTDYILPFSAALHKDNFYATQCHVEKSGKAGEEVLKHFLALK